jgi:CheY-like chemotaxis protein
MEAFLTQIIEVIFKHLDLRAIGLLSLCFCVVYIWYQHHRNKLLEEQIDFEKRKGDDFFRRIENITTSSEGTQVGNPEMKTSDSTHESKLDLNVLKNLKHLLIVDDETSFRQSIAHIMRNYYSDTQIEEAEDGEEALRKISNKLPSLVLLDIAMPKKSGLEVLSELKRRKINVPVIVITAYASKDLMESKGFKIGKNILFLQKPITLEEVHHSISEILREHYMDSKQRIEHDSE